MRRRNSRTSEPTRIGQRLFDILSVLAQNDNPYIRTWMDTSSTIRYDIEGLHTYREALERLELKGILELGVVGEETESVKLTDRGLEMLRTGMIILSVREKK
jgi:hypothetical protein